MTGKVKILIVTITVFLAALAIGYYIYNKGPVDVRKSNGIAVDANELYALFVKDSSFAQQKYAGRIVAVSGNVEDTKSSGHAEGIILLSTGNPGAHINCTMDEVTRPVRKNEKVTIKGICSGIGEGDLELGLMGDVYLTRCLLIQ
jgi:hypothetical protein